MKDMETLDECSTSREFVLLEGKILLMVWKKMMDWASDTRYRSEEGGCKWIKNSNNEQWDKVVGG